MRLRLTALYGVLFLVSGAVLLAIASGVVVARSSTAAVSIRRQQAAPRSPRWPGRRPIQQLQHAARRGAASQTPQRPYRTTSLIGSLIALGIMTVVSVVLGWLVAGRALRPLREMTAAARRISADNLHERLAVTGPADELKELGDTIDGLLERLEGAFTAQRRFVANASHELRTPLTTMRASLDVAVAKPEPVPPQTIALAAGCAPSWTGSTSCSRLPGAGPRPARRPARPRDAARSNTSSPRPWPIGPAAIAARTSPCTTPAAAAAPG